MDTDDASQKLSDENIDQILERRAKVVKHSECGNVFSKTTSQVNEEIEDPDLLAQKSSEESESRIKRQCRRLSREGNISDEDREESKSLYSIYILNNDPKKIPQKLGFEELDIFCIFITVLYKSIFDIFSDNLGNSADNLKYLIKYCVDLLPSQRLKNDFRMCLDKFYLDYDPHIFLTQSELYLKFHEKFLFKIQVPLILKTLVST